MIKALQNLLTTRIFVATIGTNRFLSTIDITDQITTTRTRLLLVGD